MTALEDIYTAEWVAHDFADLRAEFHLVAKAIDRLPPPLNDRRTIVDVGCGPAQLLEGLMRHGRDIVGYEGSRHCIDYASNVVKPFLRYKRIEDMTTDDIAFPWGHRTLEEPDLVICTEVAEHLDARVAPHLVELLCAPKCPIIFTAAPPGQDGHHHVNCQPQSYWLGLFARHGVIADEALSVELAKRWWALDRLSHMRRNVMVLR